VIITDVILPTTIVDQMAAKTMVISQNAAQKMNQEFEMLTLKQNEEVETLKQKNKEEREKEKQSGDMEVNEVQVQLDKMKAETKVRHHARNSRAILRNSAQFS
jgi:sensor histidine kinase YesM